MRKSQIFCFRAALESKSWSSTGLALHLIGDLGDDAPFYRIHDIGFYTGLHAAGVFLLGQNASFIVAETARVIRRIAGTRK